MVVTEFGGSLVNDNFEAEAAADELEEFQSQPQSAKMMPGPLVSLVCMWMGLANLDFSRGVIWSTHIAIDIDLFQGTCILSLQNQKTVLIFAAQLFCIHACV